MGKFWATVPAVPCPAQTGGKHNSSKLKRLQSRLYELPGFILAAEGGEGNCANHTSWPD